MNQAPPLQKAPQPNLRIEQQPSAVQPAGSAIVLFDGVCNLCSRTVQFILRRDPGAYFRFAALQSPAGQRLLRQHGLSSEALLSIVLIEQGQVYVSSDAVLRIARRLEGAWTLGRVLLWVPRGLRDRLYQWVAAHRYRWFGQANSCLIASPGDRHRFLDNV